MVRKSSFAHPKGITMFEGKGRTIVVCGIANPSVIPLLKQGYNVMLLAHSAEQADKMRERIPSEYLDHFDAAFCRIEEPEEVKAMAEQAIARFGCVNAIATGVGPNEKNSFDDTDPEEFFRVLQATLRGHFIYMKTMIPYLLRFEAPRIINLTCIDWKCGHFDYGVSAATGKGGLVALTRAIALEYAGKGLTANCIAVGALKTLEPRTPEREQELNSKIPVGRIATGDDIAPAIAFLASRESSYMTGAVLNMSGGAYMD
ncbi:MAG: SDR family oxidoreductase [Lachnospiraceae bacterium]|nr:SDR family oxidoreductase [Lachnospiraceae bacterium]